MPRHTRPARTTRPARLRRAPRRRRMLIVIERGLVYTASDDPRLEVCILDVDLGDTCPPAWRDLWRQAR